MIQKVLFKILFILFFYSVVNAELLKPSIGGEEKEILKISDKRRIYTILRKDSLVYEINGPARIELISRYPANKKTKQSQKFSYMLTINKEKPIIINHRYKIQESIRSVQHPNHYYTYSGNYFFNIANGNHRVVLKSIDKEGYPVLLRVLKKDFEKPSYKRNEIIPMVYQSNREVMIDGKAISYYELTNNRPLQLELKGPKKVRILSRLIFDEYMGTSDKYRLRIKSGKKVIGTYLISSERSSSSYILNMENKIGYKVY